MNVILSTSVLQEYLDRIECTKKSPYSPLMEVNEPPIALYYPDTQLSLEDDLVAVIVIDPKNFINVKLTVEGVKREINFVIVVIPPLQMEPVLAEEGSEKRGEELAANADIIRRWKEVSDKHPLNDNLQKKITGFVERIKEKMMGEVTGDPSELVEQLKSELERAIEITEEVNAAYLGHDNPPAKKHRGLHRPKVGLTEIMEGNATPNGKDIEHIKKDEFPTELDLSLRDDFITQFVKTSAGYIGFTLIECYCSLPDPKTTMKSEREYRIYERSLNTFVQTAIHDTMSWLKRWTNDTVDFYSPILNNRDLFTAATRVCGLLMSEYVSNNPKRGLSTRYAIARHTIQKNQALKELYLVVQRVTKSTQVSSVTNYADYSRRYA